MIALRDLLSTRSAPSEAVSDLLVNEYRTNDYVRLIGSLGSDKYLKINGWPMTYITSQEFTFLLVLIAHKHTAKPGQLYLTAKQILDCVERWSSQDFRFTTWPSATVEEVHRTAYDLRKKIAAIGANKDIIESGRSEKGYRLSTSRLNVDIVFEM